MDNSWKKTEDVKPDVSGESPLAQMIAYLNSLQSHYEGELSKEKLKLTLLESELQRAAAQKNRRKGDHRG